MLDFRDRKIRRLFILAVAWFVILMLAGSAYVMQHMERQKIDSGLDLATLQARSFEDYLTQSLNNIDLTLRNTPIRRETAHPSLGVYTLALRNAPYLRSISLMNNEGRIYFSTNPHNVGKQVTLGDFLPALQSPSDTLRIGRLWRGRDFADGNEINPDQPAQPDALVFLPVLHTIQTGHRTFTLLAAVNTDYFINHFSQHMPADSGYTEVLRLDRTLLLSTNEKQAAGARPPAWRQGSSDIALSGAREQILDGKRELIAFQASRNLPFAVHVHLDLEQFLAPWKQQMRMMLALVGVSVISIIGFAIFIYRRLLRSAQLQETADEQLRLMAQVFKSSAEAIFIATSGLRIYSVNRAFSHITGYSAHEVIGNSPDLLRAEQNSSTPWPDWHTINSHSPWIGEVSHRRKNGELYPAFLTVSCITDDNGHINHYIGVFSDATERKISERFRYLSEHDFLTGLPNRRLFQEHLSQSMARIQRHGGHLALLFLDLDHFKPINDTLGHHVGDLLLKEVASRLQASIRTTDTLCRQGGDEFLLLIDDIEDADDARHVAEKLVKHIGEPYLITGHELNVTPSIGIAIHPDQARDIVTLIHQADVAMYQSKHHGRNHFCFYHESMEEAHASLHHRRNTPLA